MEYDSVYKGLMTIWRLIDTNPVTICDHVPFKRGCLTCSKELLNDRFCDASCTICNSRDRLIIEWFRIDDYRPVCISCCYKIRTKQIF